MARISDPVASGLIGGGVVVAAAAAFLAGESLTRRPAVKRALTRLRLNSADRAEYDALLARYGARYLEHPGDAQVLEKYVPALFPTYPDKLTAFTMKQLVTALERARAERDTAYDVYVEDFDRDTATRWVEQVEAIRAEITRRRYNYAFPLNALDRVRADMAVASHEPYKHEPTKSNPDAPGGRIDFDAWWRHHGNPTLAEDAARADDTPAPGTVTLPPEQDLLVFGPRDTDTDTDDYDSGAEFDDTGDGMSDDEQVL